MPRELHTWLSHPDALRALTAAMTTDAFHAVFYGVSNKLSEQRESTLLEDHKFAIVLSTQEATRERYAQQNFGPVQTISLRDPRRRNWSALESGFREGQLTSINPGLPGGNRDRLTLKEG